MKRNQRSSSNNGRETQMDNVFRHGAIQITTSMTDASSNRNPIKQLSATRLFFRFFFHKLSHSYAHKESNGKKKRKTIHEMINSYKNKIILEQ